MTRKRGRPADRGVRKITTSMRLTPVVLEYLSRHGDTTANVVEDCIRRTADFRRWEGRRNLLGGLRHDNGTRTEELE